MEASAVDNHFSHTCIKKKWHLGAKLCECACACVYVFEHLKKIFLSLFIFERQRESVSKGGAERERETPNPKQAPGFEVSAQEPAMGLEPTNCEIMTWAEVWCLTEEAPRASAPFILFF